MPRIIFKCPHIKSGGQKSAAHRSHLVKYIATREGVELPEKGNGPATQKQIEMVQKLIREFPLSKGMFEYEDYLESPTRRNASEFISRALEDNLDELAKRENYLEYIAQRPRVQMVGSHGLFTGGKEDVVLSRVAAEIAKHPGVVWLPIISLKREDAARLGYDNAENWQALLSGYAVQMAEAMKIPPDQFRWYAAFHDEGHHPHVHMVCYSADGKSGFLTLAGLDKIRSGLARQIFQEELTELYTRQTKRRDELTEESRVVLRDLLAQMESGVLESQRIQELMLHLARELRQAKGRKKYGYLKAPLKAVVDEIVDELEKDQRIAQAYSLWYGLREDVLRTYKDTMPDRSSLSQQKEFRRIKNIIVEEADRLGEQMEPEVHRQKGSAQRSMPSQQQSTLVLQSVIRLLHHMSRIFREQTPMPVSGGLVHVDSKLRRIIREKKMAQGHKADDHAPEMKM